MKPHFALLATVVALCGQEPPPLRVSVTLVQVDAVVTDRDGRQVTDLSKDDFELFEDGKPRAISYFAYVGTAAPAARASAAVPSVTTGTLTREQVRRTVALVVDDLRMSFDSMARTRESLIRFVDRQMEPGDLVAILSTSGGVGGLAQFTGDKRLLHAAIARIRFRVNPGGPINSLQSLGKENEQDGPGEMGALVRRRFAVGTLASVRYIAEGMRDLPGRKSLVLISEGLSMRTTKKTPPVVTVAQMHGVTDSANRAAVVMYTVDARALWVPALQAQDDTLGHDPVDLNDELAKRGERLSDNQVGLEFLAAETGGRAWLNSNDFNVGYARMLEDQSGYYLLGFQPGEADGARMAREGKYHRLTLRVKRPGLQVRYRKGYMGGTGAVEAKQPKTTAERLLAGLNSPFADSGVRLRLTPNFEIGESGKPEVRVLVHIPGSDVTFGPPDAEGRRAAKLDMLLATEGDGAVEQAHSGHAYTIRVKEDALSDMRAGGFVYTLAAPVKRAGPYQVRVAVFDELSGRVGSASRFLEVPDLKSGKVAISGITMGDGDWRSRAGRAANGESDPSPAIRVFRRDRPFSYGVLVYNARVDPESGQADVHLQGRLLQGDRVLWEARPISVVLRPGMDPRRIPAAGVLTLGGKTPAGEYVLQVQAVRKDGQAIATEWTDFELR